MVNDPAERLARDQVFAMTQKLGARLLSECAGPNESLLRFYTVDGKVFIVQFFKEGGWHNYLGSHCSSVRATEVELQEWARR